MKRTFLLISTITGLLLAGCSGGGGGGNGSDGTTYSGLTTPAVITEENAPDMAESALEAREPGEVSEVTDGLFGVVTEIEDQSPSPPFNILVTQTLAKHVKHIDFNRESFLPGAVHTKSDSIPCDSGTANYSMTIDDGSGRFSGSLNFNDCSSEGMNWSGSLSLSGSVDDINNPERLEIAMSFFALTANDGQESITMGGQMTMTISNSSVTTLMNFVSNNNLTGESAKLENYEVSVTDYGSEIWVELSGRFYHPEHGYGDVTTDTPLQISYLDDWPHAGVFTVKGQDSSLRVDCAGNGPDTYLLQLDVDGTAGYETSSIEDWQ